MDAVALESMPEGALLNLRIRDLPIAIEGTWLQHAVTTLYTELGQRSLAFRPECYLADEWFTPTDEPVIAIPFYLAHPRLIALEERNMLEAEGSTEDECRRLLRHEAAHALSHAYTLQRLPAWRACFGDPKQPYAPEVAKPRLYSRRFVTNLEKGYAQTHPDEDWAETFAVWLNPASRWKQVYKGWPALKKLEFVDRLMGKISSRPVPLRKGRKTCQATHMTTRLKFYYEKKRVFYKEQFPDFFDSDLIEIFSSGEPVEGRQRAGLFLNENRRRLIEAVARWTRARRYTIDELLKKLIRRCDTLKLEVRSSPNDVILSISSYLTAMAAHYSLTGKLKRT